MRSVLDSWHITIEDLISALREQLPELLNNSEKNWYVEMSYLDIEEVRASVKEFWKERDKSKQETIPEFIKRVYDPWIWKWLTRAHLQVYRTLYSEQAKWVSKNGGSFPDWLDLPTAYSSHPNIPPTQKEIKAWKRVEAYRAKKGSIRT